MKNLFKIILGIFLLSTPIIAIGQTYPYSQQLAPSPSNGQFLKTNGATSSWATVSASAVWGSITGTLSSQTDLQTALNALVPYSYASSTYYLATNPSSYITASSLSPYITTVTANSTFPSFTYASSTYLFVSASTSLAYIPFASSTLYVPYTGATGGVNLNNQSLANVSTLSVGSATAPTGGVAYFNGNVGIGTTGPTNMLDVIQSGSTAGVRVSGGTNPQMRLEGTTAFAKLQVCDSCSGGLNDSGSGIGLFGTENAYPFAIYTNNSERVRITSTGNVGIGTTSPISLLSVMASGTPQNSPFISFNSTTSPIFNVLANGNVGIGTTTPTSALYIQSASTTEPLLTVASSTGASLFTVLANGNVGIGTSNPTDILTIGGTVNNGITMTGTNPQITAINSSDYLRIANGVWGYYGNAGNGWAFYDTKAAVTRTFLAADTGNSYILGNVGIANTAPTYPLTVGTTTTGGQSSAYFAGGIMPRIVGYTASTSITVNTDILDIATTTFSFATTTLNNPSGTPHDAQMFVWQGYATTSQAVAFGTIFATSTDVTSFPSAIASGTVQFLFQYRQAQGKWIILGQ